jgi:hypothetical protein
MKSILLESIDFFSSQNAYADGYRRSNEYDRPSFRNQNEFSRQEGRNQSFTRVNRNEPARRFGNSQSPRRNDENQEGNPRERITRQ